MDKTTGNKSWADVKEMLGKHQVQFGPEMSRAYVTDPRGTLQALSFYKFASKLIGRSKKVLDLAREETLGPWVLAVECGSVQTLPVGSAEPQATMGSDWLSQRVDRLPGGFSELMQGQWDALVSFDLKGRRPHDASLIEKMSHHLGNSGIVIVGEPHVSEDLERVMNRCFHHVFTFRSSDEVIRSGRAAPHEFSILVGCRKRVNS